jgi:molecular chaperone GrpE (heat shock protein)
MVGSAQDAKNLGKEQMAAMSMSGGAMAETAMQAQKNANLLNSKQVKNAEDFDKLQKDIATSQESRQKSTAAAAAESEQAFKNLGAELMAALMPVIKDLTPVIQDLAQQMMQFAKDNMPAIKEGLQMVVQFVKDLFSPEGREKIGKQLAEGLGKLLSAAWDSFSLFGDGKKDKAAREATNQEHAAGGGNRSEGMDFSAGSFADGGVASGPTSGYMANLHGTEAIVPLPDGRNLPVNLDMKMPQMTDMAKEFQSFKSDLQQNLAEKETKSPVEDMFASMKESLFGKTESKSTEATTDMSSKDLLTELQQLNKQTAQMLAYMRDSTDFSRRNLDAIRGLNGNLLI